MRGELQNYRIGPVGAGALLALIVAAAFWPVLSGARMFFHLDLRYEHLPVWDVTQKALLSHENPFWIDGEYCGHPLLFHQEAPLFYPLTVPLLLTDLSVQRLTDMFSLFHFWLAGFSAWLFFRALRTDPYSALFGGVAWMLSARLLQSAIWPNAVAVSAFLPLLLLGILQIASGSRKSAIILTSVSGGLAILASRPHVLLAAMPLISAAVVRTLIVARRRWRAAGELACAASLALALGAPALLPALALFPEMSRAQGLPRSERDVNPIGRGTDFDMLFLPVDYPPRWPEAAAYPGFLVGALFIVGIVFVLKKDLAFPVGLFLTLLLGGTVGLIFAFGEAGPYRLVASLPLIRGFRVPARYLVSWALALALGATIVLSHLLTRFRHRALFGTAAVVVLACDLGSHALWAAPTAPAALDKIVPAVLPNLRRCLGRDESGFPERFWSLADPLKLNMYSDPSKIAFAHRYEPLLFALGMRFGLETVDGAGPPLDRTLGLILGPDPRIAYLAGVGCIVVSRTRASEESSLPAELEVRRIKAFPRAILVANATAVPPAQVLAAIFDPASDPRRVAIVEDPDASLRSVVDEPAGVVRLLSRRPGRVEMVISAPSERLLVVFDAFEKGWSASVDGLPTRVIRANGVFRGVQVAGGTHRVIQAYKPPALFEGIALFLVGLLGLALVARRSEDLSGEPIDEYQPLVRTSERRNHV